MKTCSRMCFLLVMVVTAGCAKVDQAPAAVTGGKDGSDGGVGSGTGGFHSGTGATSGTGGDLRGSAKGGGGMGGQMGCGLVKFPVTRRPVDILVLLDRSASMARDSMDKDIPAGSTIVSKWDQIVPALTEVIGGVSGDLSWGLKVFPEGDAAQCTQTTLTKTIDVQIASMNVAAIASGIKSAMPTGNGTPTGATFEVATEYLRGLADDHRKFILFATDGQPSCAGSVGSLSFTGGGSMAAISAATTAIAAAAQAGFHTFVVGVATKDSDTATLSAWATAGLEPRKDPNPLATKFYLGSTKDELVSAFKTITNVAQTCVFALPKPPPVPENIAVKVTGVKAPFDSSNTTGWNYTDQTDTTVEVFGSWCDMIKTAAADMVEVTFGCPDVVIP